MYTLPRHSIEYRSSIRQSLKHNEIISLQYYFITDIAMKTVADKIEEEKLNLR